ncbi:hypothetical protein DFQ27_008641 [Actinomortierella ambigua]|uniref:Uncharacterized protein n=1 Tax=Actinomortierella ambigua TaxID=1343610 RepID=A0A9P6PS90_9FUNG|nr:hypothetical protein DFQ27_008641 [Actinomortierella ambigua]
MSARRLTLAGASQQSCDDDLDDSPNEHDENSPKKFGSEISSDNGYIDIDADSVDMDVSFDHGTQDAATSDNMAMTSSQQAAHRRRLEDEQVTRGHHQGRKIDLEFQRDLHQDKEHHFAKLSYRDVEALADSDKDMDQQVANFSSVTSDQYSLYLLVKQAGDDTSASRFCVRILVRYPATRTTHVFYTRFFKSSKDEGTEWQYIKAECQFEVLAQVGSAQVNINITPDESFHDFRGELLIRSLQLVPVGVKPLGSAPVLSRVSHVDDSVALQPADDLREGVKSNPYRADNGRIVRLVTSKDGNFLAALCTLPEKAVVHVWHKNSLKRDENQFITPMDVSHMGFVSDPITYRRGTRDPPLELAISATGDYIAVFQAPKIGDWLEGSQVPSSDIGVRLFRTPPMPPNDVVISVGPSVTTPLKLRNVQDTPDSFTSAVGYAVFVDQFTSGTYTTPARFVFCDGLYLDVYELQEKGLRLKNSIPLVKMSSALLRTTVCDLMMRSIVTNMFIWVEDNGRYCSTWDLSSGSAIGRIEITRLLYGSSVSISEMSVACSQNIIAIVGYDNSITTVDASTGVVLSRRANFDHVIEQITFPSAQSQMLLVMTRAEDENKQTGLILDPLQLEIQERVRSVPPLSGPVAFGLHGSMPWPEIGVVCRSDGPLIHFSSFKGPAPLIGRRQLTAAGDVVGICSYELKVGNSTGSREDGEHGRHRRQIEIWKKGVIGAPVFAFIPEPWDQYGNVSGMILPTGDCFVVYGSWTIQLWSLPTDEPRCRLLFFWSAAKVEQSIKRFGKTDLEVITENYTRISSAFVHEYLGTENQRRFQVTVVFLGGPVKQIPIPNNPVHYYDFQFVTERCIESIWLLALTHAFVSSELRGLHTGDQGVDDNKEHALAIRKFVNVHINHVVTDPETLIERTILNELVGSLPVTELNSKFIAALLEDEGCSWIPCIAVKSHPIESAIGLKSTTAVRAMLGYCTRKAVSTHPAYMLPVEHAFTTLADNYPEIMQDVFRRASYIPAQQIDFNTTYWAKSTFNWSLKKLIFSFHLRWSRGSSRRSIRFLPAPPLKPIQLPYDHIVYVAPFPSLTAFGSGSQFPLLAGKRYFDSPVMMAILRYKTWQYGLFFWILRYILLGLFYGTFLTTTSGQLISSRAFNSAPEPLSNYLGSYWIVIPLVGIVVGCYFVIEEVLQLALFGPARYFRSLYNYIEVTSIILTIICLAQTINMSWRQEPSSYHQFQLTSFAIVAMYLHLISETRIFKAVGTTVNTIVLVVQRIWGFFIVYVLLRL